MIFAFEKFQETLPNFMGMHTVILYFKGSPKQSKTVREAESLRSQKTGLPSGQKKPS